MDQGRNELARAREVRATRGRTAKPVERAQPDVLVANPDAFVGMAHKLATSLDPRQTAELAVAEAAAVVGASLAALYLKEPDGSLALAALAGEGGLRTAPSIARRALALAAPAVADSFEVEELGGSSDEAIALPLTSQGEALGVLLVATAPQTPLAPNMTLLSIVADLTAASLVNATRFARTLAEARSDGLTGLGNHRAFHEHLDLLLRDALAQSQHLSLVLFDLDDFKLINDGHGHLAGDQALRRVARLAVAELRAGERPFRMGGEEFAVVVQGTSEAGASVAERLRRAAAGERLHRDFPTLSAGVATFPDDARTKDELVHKADLALYAAKRGGKNLVVVYGRDVRGAASRSSVEVAREDLRERMGAAGARTRVGTDLGAVSAALAGLARATTPRKLLEGTARGLTALLNGTACVVSRLDGEVLRDAASHCPPPFDLRLGYGYLLDDYPLTRQTIETGTCQAVSLSDQQVDPGEAFVLRELNMHAVVMVPLNVLGRPWGLVEVYDARPRRFDADEAALAELVVGQAAAVLAQFEQSEEIQALYRETIASLANALEAKDGMTGAHAQSVVELAIDVGARLGLTGIELQSLELGALLHDIGKIEVPEAILTKPGRLTEEEWRVIRAHPEAGVRIVEPIQALRDVLPIIRSSHERWDGAGYPDGLAGEAIPLGARIVAACDSYCAMVEGRPYRAAVPVDSARRELRDHAGTQFDPSCIAALLTVLDERGHERAVRLHRPGDQPEP
jgi:diguanylate cyclase (GGDEF)-like protein